MLTLLFRNFLRSRIAVAGLAILLFSGVVSIYIGKQHLTKQQHAIAETDQFQQEHIKRNVGFFKKELGLLMYYLKFGFVNQPDALSALFIGQRDVNSSIQQVTIRGLENQRYDTDLLNPSNLLAGNLDFGFVIIYLFPLLIIAFCYNILSEEKEEGTWSLISLQSSNPTVVLYYKFAIRALVCFAALYFLFGLACVSLGIPLNERLALVVLISSLYLLFWFAACYFISSFQKNSSTNALLLLSTWILLTMILPAIANNYILTKYPAPEALEMMVEQRQGYHEKWDMNKEVTIEKFYSHYPQYKKHGFPEGQFNWLWYYAMQQSGDDDAAQHTAALKEKLLMREKVNRSLSMFNPSMHALFHFNRLATSDLGNQIRYLDAVAAYHEKLRLHFYPMIFENKPVDGVDWSQFKVVYFKDDQKPFWILSVMPLLFFIGLLTFIGHLNLRKLNFV